MIYAKVSELPDVLRYALERLNYNRKDIAIEAKVDLDGNEYPIPEGFAVIKGSEGDGVSASLYLHPSNLAPMLKQGEQLDPRDRWILYTFAVLTSAGRKNEWEREKDKPSEDDLNRLAARGYLKRSKNGATQITTEGKNALGRRGFEAIYHPNKGQY